MTSIPLSGRVRLAHRSGYAAWAGLALLQVIWHAWWWPPVHGSPMLAAVVALVPLLLPLLAIRRPSRALLWAGIIALFYFCHGIATAWSVPPARVPALLETFLSLVIVMALGAAVQRRKPSGPASVTTPADEQTRGRS